LSSTHRIELLNELAWEFKFDAPEQARALLSESAQLAQQIEDQKQLGNAFNYRGVIEDIHQNVDSASYYFTKALVLRDSLGDLLGVAKIYNNLGNVALSQNDYQEAAIQFKRYFDVSESLKDSLRMARAQYSIANAYEALGDYVEALRPALDYLTFSQRSKDQYAEASAHNLIANIKMELERIDEAAFHIQEAIRIREDLGEPYELAQSIQNYGNIIDNAGELLFDRADSLGGLQIEQARQKADTSLVLYKKALQLYQQMEDEEGVQNIYNNMGSSYKNLGTYALEQGAKGMARNHFQDGLTSLDKSLQMARRQGNREAEMEVYNSIGDIYRRQFKMDGQPSILAKAFEMTQAYGDIARELGNQKFIQKSHKDFSRLYALTGEYKKAFESRKAYDELRYKRLDEQRARTNARREALYGDLEKQRLLEVEQKENQLKEAELREANILTYAFGAGALGLLALALLWYNRYRLKNRSNQALADKNRLIEEERKRSDELLLNILPQKTAQELKTKGKSDVRQYPEVTVLFTDFKSFTQITEQMSPQDLVAELDTCFKAFDEITMKHGIEKIKTIGDAYMCVSGLPEESSDHAIRAVQAATDMLVFMQGHQAKQAAAGKPKFEIRIGLHSGPVIAGIVGSRKFAYDVWGDTVNMAARMESSGAAGQINISDATYQLIKPHFNCNCRGQIEAKNKGLVDMYFVSQDDR